MDQAQYKINTPIGLLYLVASHKGLQQIHWKRQPVRLVASLNRLLPQEKILDDASSQLKEYFNGARKKFNVPFDLTGTPFQRAVWRQLAQIPFGQTCSYKDIARKVNNPKAVRAVGSANGKNPVCVMIPCHRVIAADGSIGGYAGGVATKRKLLRLEGTI